MAYLLVDYCFGEVALLLLLLVARENLSVHYKPRVLYCNNKLQSCLSLKVMSRAASALNKLQRRRQVLL